MAASPHALGVGTPSITKWMLPSSSSSANANANAGAGAGGSATTCAAACGPAAPLPRLRLAASSSSTSCCSSAVQAQAPRHQAKLRLQATAVDGEVSVAEEQASPSASPFVLEEGLEQQPQQRRRGNAGRRVSVKSEDLKEGALFPGTVRTVTTYGAFVDIGAFTDGLVHISQLSDSYVSQVQDLVAVGQQVSVRILDVDFNAGRISLSMRPVPAPVSADVESEGNAAEGDAAAAPRGPPSERRKIAGRGNSANKSSSSSSKPSVQKGQTLTGVVKNVIKSGAFVTLPGGDEGFLRATDMSNPGTVLESLVGQELSVRVQRIDGRGKVSLTQKVEVDMKQINLSINNNELGGAANPFELAFRKSNFVVQEDEKAGEAVAAEDSEDEVASQEEIAVAEALTGEAVAAEDSEDGVPAQEEIAVPEALAGEAVAAEVDEVASEEEIAVPEALAGESVAPEDSEVEVASQEEIAVPEALAGAAVAAEDGKDEVASQEEVAVPEASAGEAVAAEDSADEVASQAEIAVPEASAGEAVAAEDSEDKVASQEEIAVPEASAGEAVAAEDSADEVASQEEIAVPEASAGEAVAAEESEGKVASEEETAVPEASAGEAVAAEDSEGEVASQEEIAVPEASAGEAVDAEEREDEVPSQEEIAVPEASSGEAVAAEESEDEVASEEETAVPEASAGEAVAAEDSEDEVASQEEIAVAEALEVEETLRPVEDAVVEVSSVAEDTSSSAGDTGVESASVPEVEETVAEETTVAVEEQEVQVPAPVVEASVSRPEPVQEPEAKKDVASAGAAAVAASALVVAPALVKELRQISGAGMMDCKKALVACNNNLDQAVEYLRKKGLASADKKASRVAAEGAIGSYIHDGRIGVLIEVNSETDFVARGEKFKELVQDLAMQVAAYPQVQYVSVEDIPEEIAERERQIESTKEDLASKPEAVRSKIVEGRVSKLLKEVALLEQPYIRNDKVLVREHIKETIAVLGENLQVRRFHRFNLGEGIQKKVANLAAEVAEQTKPKEVKDVPPPAAKAAAELAGSAPEVVVPAAAVKVLRQATGAGMMDCKKALAACGGDVEKATEYLRKKGLASAEKKASRVAAEGAIGKYIHDGRIGVLLEVNCETDFVARGDRFKELVQDLAMQVVACPQVQYVSLEDIPAEYVAREKEVESQKEDLASKPEAVRSKIVDGRVSKRLVELALLEQAYIRNDKVLVKDHVKETIAALGENIQVRRFVKFVLGEGIQKKTVDFAAEVAAQTRPK